MRIERVKIIMLSASVTIITLLRQIPQASSEPKTFPFALKNLETIYNNSTCNTSEVQLLLPNKKKTKHKIIRAIPNVFV